MRKQTELTISLTSCGECRAGLSPHAETCPACGYPVKAQTHDDQHGECTDTARSTLKEYKLIQLLGGFITCVGIATAMADSSIIATIAVTVGIGTYITGLLGAWWNTSD